MNHKIKKNILDIHYHKYLQYQTTAIVIIFTYLIGICIGWITKQINFTSISEIIILTAISLIVFIPTLALFAKSSYHLKRIPKLIKKLEIE